MKEKSLTLSVIIKVLIICLSIFGTVDSITKNVFMGNHQILFFTTQSNMAMVFVALIFLCFDLFEIIFSSKITVPRWLYIAKYIFTVGISLTFAVFSVMLAPFILVGESSSYLLSLANLCCHNLVPILSVLDWILFDKDKINLTDKKAFWGLSMPTLYLITTAIFSLCGADYGATGNVPYFFLDYKQLTWVNINIAKQQIGVVYWLIGILLLTLGICFIYRAISRATFGKGQTKAQNFKNNRHF